MAELPCTEYTLFALVCVSCLELEAGPPLFRWRWVVVRSHGCNYLQ